MNKFFFTGLLIVFHTLSGAQCLIPSNEIDSNFLVTNKYNTYYSPFSHIIYNTAAQVFNIVPTNGKYYLLGSFTNLCKNSGSALVVDTSASVIRTPQKWKNNGLVLASIPDGQGGFFICGNFSKIGDSSRINLAQIKSNGQPTAWNPLVNGIVRTLYKRNDTLFVAGEFTSFKSKSRNCFAMYSLSGDSVLNGNGFPLMSGINSFLIQRDTVIVGGESGTGMKKIWKYNFKNNIMLPWQLAFFEFGEIKFLQFSEDSSTLIYCSDYGADSIIGVNTLSGIRKYGMKLTEYSITNNIGKVFGLKTIGNKVYVVGHFNTVLPRLGGAFTRKGFLAFDASSGNILSEDLNLDNYATFIDGWQNKICISGKFTTVRGIGREYFAVLDTGSLSVGPLQLSPSDALSTLSFSNQNMFVGGHFNGVYSVHRNGFAAIDSATNNVLPWSPQNNSITEGKRMFIRGDSLFVLGITSRPSSCMVNDFNTEFKVYSLSTGLPFSTGNLSFTKMYDFTIEGNYLYASIDNQVRRYLLPSLTKDASWGAVFNAQSPMYLIVSGNKLYSVGDNRFEQQCTNLPARRGSFVVYNMTTGLPDNYYSYEGANNSYDQIVFDHALLSNDRLYIQGYFAMLNGKPRRNFACININNGQVTDWNVSFPNTDMTRSYFHRTSDLKLFGGKIWFGSTIQKLNSGKNFDGIGAIDTITGNLMPSVISMIRPQPWVGMDDEIEGRYVNAESAFDFFFTNTTFVCGGGFNFINNVSYNNLLNSKLTTGSPPAATGSAIIGSSTLIAGTDSNRFYIPLANLQNATYNWSYSGNNVEIKNNGSDTVWLKVSIGATNGVLKVFANNFCGNAPPIQINITISNPSLPPLPDVKNISNKCQNAASAKGKLNNPPSGATITITQDGAPLSYSSTDSSFQYFTIGVTNLGNHIITIKYSNIIGTVQTDTSYTVFPTITASVSISGNTTVNQNVSSTLTASPTNGGNIPNYQWQDSININGWQNITGATNSTLNYTPLSSGNKLRCRMTSSANCATPVTSVSNVLVFTVNVATGINSVAATNYKIKYFPNPVHSILIIDSLKLSDKWQTVEIITMDGRQKLTFKNISNQTSVIIRTDQLSSGCYIGMLRKKGGEGAFFKFIKL